MKVSLRYATQTLALIAFAGLGLNAAPAFAGATPASVVNLKANVLQSDGTYLWSYKVTAPSNDTMSYWILDLSDSLTADLKNVVKSVSETAYAIKYDSNTGLNGIAFTNDYAKGESRIVNFTLASSYTSVLQSAGMYSGSCDITYSKVYAPGVKTTTSSAVALPEPSTLGLLALAPIALGVVRRRRAK